LTNEAPERNQAGFPKKCVLFPNGCVAVRDHTLSFETSQPSQKYEKIDM